jgi:hypothetical protein
MKWENRMAKDQETKKPRADWDAIERDYRTGKFTLRELGAKHDISHGRIAQVVKAKGWTQDLSRAVRAATNAALIEAAVNKDVNRATHALTNTVQIVAEMNRQVITAHRSELQQARALAGDLLAELRESAMGAQNMELMAQILAGEDASIVEVAQARKAIARALGIGSRVSSIKALADAFTKLHEGERKAFGLDGVEKPGDDDKESADRLRDLPSDDRRALLEMVRRARSLS